MLSRVTVTTAIVDVASGWIVVERAYVGRVEAPMRSANVAWR